MNLPTSFIRALLARKVYIQWYHVKDNILEQELAKVMSFNMTLMNWNQILEFSQREVPRDLVFSVHNGKQSPNRSWLIFIKRQSQILF